MGQELELPRRNNLIKITQHEARYDDCRKSPLLREGLYRTEQTKEMPIQNKRRINFLPNQTKENSRSQRRDNHTLHIWPLHSQSKFRPGECHVI